MTGTDTTSAPTPEFSRIIEIESDRAWGAAYLFLYRNAC